MLILTQRRRIVKPTPGEVWLHGNPHPLAKGLVFAGGISSDHGGTRYFDFAKKQHGTLTNMDPATDWVGSPYGWALDFDGSNDYISLPSAIASLTYPYTIIWRALTRSTVANQAVVTLATTDAASSNLSGFFAGGMIYGGNSTVPARYSVGYSANRWYHFATVRSPSNSDSAYLDGNFLTRTTNDFWSATNLNIGARANGGSLRLDGQVSSVLIYNRALSASEIAELYQDPGFSWATRPRRRVFGFTASGGTTFNESGDLSAIPSLTSSETITLSESGTLSAIPTLTADQTVSLSGVGDLSAIPSLTAEQTIAVNESGDLSGIPSLTGDVANAFDESATLSGIPSLTGDHTYTLQGVSTLSAVPSLTADQTVTMNLSGELSAIPSLTGVDTGLAGVTAFNGGGRSEFVGPPARSSQFRSGRNNVSEFRTGRWVN